MRPRYRIRRRVYEGLHYWTVERVSLGCVGIAWSPLPWERVRDVVCDWVRYPDTAPLWWAEPGTPPPPLVQARRHAREHPNQTPHPSKEG